MKQHLFDVCRDSFSSVIPIHKRRILAFCCLIALFSCLFFLLRIKGAHSEIDSANNETGPIMLKTSTIPPTKWWIKTKIATSFTPLSIATGTFPAEARKIDCLSSYGSPLQPGIFAYISLAPPLPNRVRAGAGRATLYLGQIQPGAGVRIIDGSLCADGFSWWLVETVESDLRGWTVAGSKSEQWVLPCPNPAVACKMSPVIQQATPTTTHSSTQGNNDHTCTSNGIFIGMPTQVKEDNLLVVRSEPYTGSVIGHAGPMSAVTIVDGPACAGGTVWWKVKVASLTLTGWATEANLRTCTKEDGCT